MAAEAYAAHDGAVPHDFEHIGEYHFHEQPARPRSENGSCGKRLVQEWELFLAALTSSYVPSLNQICYAERRSHERGENT